MFQFKSTISPGDDHHHDDEDNEDEPKKEADEASGPAVNIEQIVPIIDSILEQDDKVITKNINIQLEGVLGRELPGHPV